MQRLNDDVEKFIQGLPQGVPPHNANFGMVIEDAFKELEKYYLHMYIQIKDVYPEEKEDGSHYQEYRQTLLFNASGFINFAIFSTAYKVNNLLNDVVSGLNENNALRVAMSARAIIEYCVTFRNFKRTIEGLINSMSTHHQDIEKYEFGSEEFINSVNDYDNDILSIVNAGVDFSKATRFNWSTLFESDSSAFDSAWNDVSQQTSQKNVMTLIEKYPDQKTKKIDNEILKYYALLCEYTHPNIGSHHLITENITRVHPTMIMYTFKPTPESEIPLTHAVRAITTPLTICLPNLFEELSYCRDVEQFFLHMFNSMLGINLDEQPS